MERGSMKFAKDKLLIKLVLVLLLVLSISILAAAVSAVPPMVKPECQDRCGNLSIPFPFGTRPDCYFHDGFLITCNSTNNNTVETPFLRYGNLEVLNISLDGRVRVYSQAASECYDQKGLSSYDDNGIVLSEFYSLSSEVNKFVAVGCDTTATFRGYTDPTGDDYYTGCKSYCYSIDSIINGSCSGIGCCQLPVPKGARLSNFSLDSFSNHSDVLSYNPCSYAFVVEDGFYKFSSLDLANSETRQFPVALDWSIGNTPCAEAKRNLTAYACLDKNSKCVDSDKRPASYLCNCSDGFRGNPYLTNGCQDIDECSDRSSTIDCVHQSTCNNTIGSYKCMCPEGYSGDGMKNGSGCQDIDECSDPSTTKCLPQSKCINTVGNYTCICLEGYSGDGMITGLGCHKKSSNSAIIIVGASVSLSALLMVLLMAICAIRKKEINKLKENNFKQNGGLMLRQLLSKVERSEEKTKIFSEKELNKATKNFNASGIIGQGGFGTVYKGTLENKTVVAIKKSKVMDHDQVEQFVNEVIVLSQIKHPNVVKLLGCCLETPVPLLVYEFITNNTLQHHLHNGSSMPWETRLDIAVQTANALAHMHSDAPIHIIHRDIKSANILLDDNFQAKVSDFGVSRLVPLDETQLSTMVLGTLGYIDPEYFNSGLLNDKSDVYSFGVVLAELLTGKKVLFPCSDGPQKEKHIAGLLISSIKEDKLSEILDPGVKNEGHMEQLEGFADLARRCMRPKGDKRPTMKEVKMELEGLRVHKCCVVQIGVDIEEAEALLGPPELCYNFVDRTKYQAPMELESGR